MGDYLSLFQSAGPAAYVILGVFILLFIVGIVFIITGGGRKRRPSADLPTDDNEEPQSKTVRGKGKATEAPPVPGVKLHAGSYKCLCFRKIKGTCVADFTTMSKPIGEMYQFDPSCPISGLGYIVKENEKGEIVDYDPREVKVETDRTPDFAWHAINWKDDVNAFWVVPNKWWNNVSNWFAAAVIGLSLFGIIVVLG